MRREHMSLPSSYVPHQWAEEGGESRVGRSICAGSRGAIQGAQRAKITKMTTNTAPVAASGLWRAARGSEMALAGNVLTKNLTMILRPRAVRRQTVFPNLHGRDGAVLRYGRAGLLQLETLASGVPILR